MLRRNLFRFLINNTEVVLYAEKALGYAVITFHACETKVVLLFYINAEPANVTFLATEHAKFTLSV